MRTVTAPDGVALAVHEHGGEGRPTLFCHATGFHGAVWEPMSAALGDGFERWAIDFRAHGASVVPPGTPLPWEAMRDDLLAVVDDLDVAPGELLGVGHSMGGAALLLAEQQRPGTFAGLWLYEPIVPPIGAIPARQGGNALAEGARRRRPSFASFEAALANFASKPPLQRGPRRRPPRLRPPRAGGWRGRRRAPGLPARRRGPPLRGRRRPRRLRAPGRGRSARWWWPAAPSRPAPPCSAPSAAEALPQGRLEVHEHLTHFGPLESPTELAASVRALAASL